MADDTNFTNTRRNFFLISILLFVLMLTNTRLGAFNILGQKIAASNTMIYAGLWLAYLYYLWRYLQELPRTLIEQSHEYFIDKKTPEIRHHFAAKCQKRYSLNDEAIEYLQTKVSLDYEAIHGQISNSSRGESLPLWRII